MVTVRVYTRSTNGVSKIMERRRKHCTGSKYISMNVIIKNKLATCDDDDLKHN